MTSVDIRVIYGDTDQMGVVYYANYLRYFEAARGAMVRAHGRSYAELERAGFALPVIEAQVRYVRPARYDDVLRVEVRVTKVRGASVRFRYEVKRGEELVADGATEHACIGPDMRPVRFPAELARWLTAEMET
jgi:acyl-CoA thioester hydrolase